MDAQVNKILGSIFGNVGSVMNIPVYQRNYSWTSKEVKKLLKDIEESNKEEEYFLGAAVFAETKNEKETIVIDGQQRILTTQLIILVVLERYLYERDEKNEENEIIIDTLSRYLFKNFVSGFENTKLKLRPNNNDSKAFEKLFSHVFAYIKNANRKYSFIKVENNNSLIFKNYKVIKKEIDRKYKNKNEINIFRKKLEQLQMVEITIEDNDDSQGIFESLNSTGADLNALDLARNFLLMKLDAATQSRLYNNYWKEIEESLGEKYMEDLLKVYLELKLKTVLNNDRKKIYNSLRLLSNKKEFKDNENKNEENSYHEAILKELKDWSIIYKIIIKRNSDIKNVNLITESLERFSLNYTKPWIPVLMVLLKKILKHNENETYIIEREGAKAFQNVLKVIENYNLRRYVSGDSAAGGALIELGLRCAAEIEKNVNHNELIKANKILVKRIASNEGRIAYIFNNELDINSQTSNLYSNSAITKELLGLIENATIQETNPEPFRLEFFEIEHIAPQTPKGEMKITDISNYRNAINTLGNLSLTVNNSSMSNDAKRKSLKTAKSKMKINDYDSHNFINDGYISAISARQKKLLKIIKREWPEDMFKEEKEKILKEKYTETSLEDIVDISKTKPIFLKINDEEINIQNWIDIYILVIKNMLNNGVLSVGELLEFPITNGKKIFFSLDATKVKKPQQIDEVFVDTNLSANNAMEYLKKICSEFLSDYENKIKIKHERKK